MTTTDFKTEGIVSAGRALFEFFNPEGGWDDLSNKDRQFWTSAFCAGLKALPVTDDLVGRVLDDMEEVGYAPGYGGAFATRFAIAAAFRHAVKAGT